MLQGILLDYWQRPIPVDGGKFFGDVRPGWTGWGKGGKCPPVATQLQGIRIGRLFRLPFRDIQRLHLPAWVYEDPKKPNYPKESSLFVSIMTRLYVCLFANIDLL